MTLGQYLGSIRADRRMTLRQVEEATNKEVSNAYLSQIENVRSKPSPNVLHALAEIYAISFSGRFLPLGRKMTRPQSLSINDLNGTSHECVAEAFDTTQNVLILLYPVQPVGGARSCVPPMAETRACKAAGRHSRPLCPVRRLRSSQPFPLPLALIIPYFA